LYSGDNSNALEIWVMRNKVRPECYAEEGASIRAVRASYAQRSGIDLRDAPSPKEIEQIAQGLIPGNQDAALAAFRELGEVVGDALANAITLLDGLIVIGGGVSNAHRLFMPALLAEMNGNIAGYTGEKIPRIVQTAFDLEDPAQVTEFLRGATKEIQVPGSDRRIQYDPLKRVGVGISRLGTSTAVSIGAYAFALHELDKKTP
jgi:glucokinase